jgi:hypothetical protein
MAREPCQTGGRSGTGTPRGLACYSLGNSTSTSLIGQESVGGPLPRGGGRAGGPGADTSAASEYRSRGMSHRWKAAGLAISRTGDTVSRHSVPVL